MKHLHETDPALLAQLVYQVLKRLSSIEIADRAFDLNRMRLLTWEERGPPHQRLWIVAIKRVLDRLYTEDLLS